MQEGRKCSCSALLRSLSTLRYFVFVFFFRNKVQIGQKNTGGMFYYFIEKHIAKIQVLLKKNKFCPKKSLMYDPLAPSHSIIDLLTRTLIAELWHLKGCQAEHHTCNYRNSTTCMHRNWKSWLTWPAAWIAGTCDQHWHKHCTTCHTSLTLDIMSKQGIHRTVLWDHMAGLSIHRSLPSYHIL